MKEFFIIVFLLVAPDDNGIGSPAIFMQARFLYTSEAECERMLPRAEEALAWLQERFPDDTVNASCVALQFDPAMIGG